MNKKLVTLLLLIVTINCSAQKFHWQGLPSGIICSDSTSNGLSDCYIGNLYADTLHNLLWVSGSFDSVQGVKKNNVAAWNGNAFIDYPFSSFSPSHFTLYNQNLVAHYKYGIWMYDFTQSKGFSLADDINLQVNALCVYNGDLIAAGRFGSIGGVGARSIARWDGTAWHPLGAGITGSTYIVYALQVYKNELYVGGTFDKAGGVDTWNIARWNGTDWNSVGGIGTNETSGNHSAADIFAMTVFQNNLYVTGRFDFINNIKTFLAYWDGTNWTGTNYPFGETNRMKSNDSAIYMSGTGYDSRGVFCWNGSQALLVDSGFNDFNPAIEFFKGELYAGGVFDSSGNTPIFHLARLIKDTSGIIDGVTALSSNTLGVRVYPNPVKYKLVIDKSQNSRLLDGQANSQIEIRNLLGQRIEYQVESIKSQYKLEMDVSELPVGIYLLQVRNKDGMVVRKFVKE